MAEQSIVGDFDRLPNEVIENIDSYLNDKDTVSFHIATNLSAISKPTGYKRPHQKTHREHVLDYLYDRSHDDMHALQVLNGIREGHTWGDDAYWQALESYHSAKVHDARRFWFTVLNLAEEDGDVDAELAGHGIGDLSILNPQTADQRESHYHGKYIVDILKGIPAYAAEGTPIRWDPRPYSNSESYPHVAHLTVPQLYVTPVRDTLYSLAARRNDAKATTTTTATSESRKRPSDSNDREERRKLSAEAAERRNNNNNNA